MLTDTTEKKDVWQGRLSSPAAILYGFFRVEDVRSIAEKTSGDLVVLEGRPRLDIGKVTSRQIIKLGRRPVVIADNMAGFLFFQKKIGAVYVAGPSRDENGAFGPTGSLILAVLCKKHNVPFYAIDGAKHGDLLAKEQELFNFEGKRVAASGIRGYAPLIEWVPGEYIRSEK